ncbi:hypothetical protein IC611_18395 [Proteus mirabilis]
MVPISSNARMFTLTVVILGITVLRLLLFM